MSLVSSAVLAFSMSADAFAVSVGKGAVHRPCWRQALRTGAIFGTVEGITPIIGWLLGLAASRYVQEVDHWIAFTILGLLGGKMLYESFTCDEEATAEPKRAKLGMLILTAIGTSIDALAVGVTFALISTNIWAMAAAIGTATFVMASIGMLAGHYIGRCAGKWAERLGGVALITIGTHILLTHLALI